MASPRGERNAVHEEVQAAVLGVDRAVERLDLVVAADVARQQLGRPAQGGGQGARLLAEPLVGVAEREASPRRVGGPGDRPGERAPVGHPDNEPVESVQIAHPPAGWPILSGRVPFPRRGEAGREVELERCCPPRSLRRAGCAWLPLTWSGCPPARSGRPLRALKLPRPAPAAAPRGCWCIVNTGGCRGVGGTPLLRLQRRADQRPAHGVAVAAFGRRVGDGRLGGRVHRGIDFTRAVVLAHRIDPSPCDGAELRDTRLKWDSLTPTRTRR